MSPAVVFKWMVLRADRAEFTRQCEELAGSTPTRCEGKTQRFWEKQMQNDEAVLTAYNGNYGELD